jgi:DNA-3-methyladenine glycosylase I
MTSVHRCAWALRSPEETVYHDTEWGVPLHDDVKLFEYLVLDGAQAGLSWTTIIKKRSAYRLAFDGFDPEAVARYDEAKIAALLTDPGIVRNRLKIESAVRNAKVYLRIQEEFGSFDAYLWRFVDGTPVRNAWRELREIPASTPLSDALSRDLKQRGCNFVGSTICYAYLQAAGLVNDHLLDCFRWSEVSGS